MENRDYIDNISILNEAIVSFAAVNNVLDERVKYLEIDIGKLEKDNAKITDLEKNLAAAEKKIRWFEEQIKLARLRKFGKKTEHNLQQLSLFDGAEIPEENSTPTNEPPVITKTITYNRCYSTGRRIDTSKLLRERVVHDLAAEEKICKCCGKDLI